MLTNFSFGFEIFALLVSPSRVVPCLIELYFMLLIYLTIDGDVLCSIYFCEYFQFRYFHASRSPTMIDDENTSVKYHRIVWMNNKLSLIY